MDIAADISRLLSDERLDVDPAWADAALRECPYFVLPLLLALKRGGVAAADRARLLARLAVAWPDRRALALQLGEGMAALAHFYPPLPEPELPDTVEAIDRFLEQYGSTSEREVAALTQAIFNPTPDYADVLAAQERDRQGGPQLAPEADGQDALINSFIAEAMEREREAAPMQAEPDRQQIAAAAADTIEQPEETDDSTLSESLAQMYVGQGKFSKALDIIERLNFSFPEKSAYFADQIRFLRGVVMIQQLDK